MRVDRWVQCWPPYTKQRVLQPLKIKYGKERRQWPLPGFAHQLAMDLNSEPPLRSAARSALEAGGFPVFAVTQQQATDIQALWDSPGLPSSLKDALTLSGVRPGVDDRLHALADSYSASMFVQQN